MRPRSVVHIIAGFALLSQAQVKTNLFETAEFRRYLSAVASLPRYRLSYWTSTGGSLTSGRITVDGDRFVLVEDHVATVWDGKKGVVFDQVTGKKTPWFRRPPVGWFTGFYLPIDGPPEWPPDLDAERLTQELKEEGRPTTVLTGWRVTQARVDVFRTIEYWFDPKTGLLSEVVLSTGGMTQPRLMRYQLYWEAKPTIPRDFPQLPDPPELRKLRFGEMKLDPKIKPGFGVLRVVLPKGLVAKVRIESSDIVSISATSGEITSTLRPGGYAVHTDLTAALMPVLSRTATTLILGGVVNRSGRPLDFGFGVLKPGEMWAGMPKEYEIEGRGKVTVTAGRITVIR